MGLEARVLFYQGLRHSSKGSCKTELKNKSEIWSNK